MWDVNDYAPELCERLASGEALHDICADDHMPAERTVYAKMAADEEFRSRIARAREAQQEYEADNIVRMADNANGEDWQVVKLRIHARQWRAAKLAPKRYGDKLDVTSDNKPIGQLSEAEAAARIERIMADARRAADTGDK